MQLINNQFMTKTINVPENINLKLYACYVGGRAEKCNTELHDIIFSVGAQIEDTYQDLKTKWFGLINKRLHLDLYRELDIIDRYKIQITKKDLETVNKEENQPKLWLINFGGYYEGVFGEIHQPIFVVARNKEEILQLETKKAFFKNYSKPHLDDKLEIDDIINIEENLENYQIKLIPTFETSQTQVVILGYHRI